MLTLLYFLFLTLSNLPVIQKTIENDKYLNPSFGYSKIIAKGYTIEFRLKAKDWGFQNKLKTYDDLITSDARLKKEIEDKFISGSQKPIDLNFNLFTWNPLFGEVMNSYFKNNI